MRRSEQRLEYFYTRGEVCSPGRVIDILDKFNTVFFITLGKVLKKRTTAYGRMIPTLDRQVKGDIFSGSVDTKNGNLFWVY